MIPISLNDYFTAVEASIMRWCLCILNNIIRIIHSYQLKLIYIHQLNPGYVLIAKDYHLILWYILAVLALLTLLRLYIKSISKYSTCLDECSSWNTNDNIQWRIKL